MAYLKFPSDYYSKEIPQHTQDALEGYIIHGYNPGSFLTSMLANDFASAVHRADTVNKTVVPEIMSWIVHYAPAASWGSYTAIGEWCGDVDQRRSSYVTNLEKQMAWQLLQQQ